MIWVPKELIIPIANKLQGNESGTKLVPGQLILETHVWYKVYIPRPPKT